MPAPFLSPRGVRDRSSIVKDVRIFTDKIVLDPRQLSVNGALDQAPAA